MPQQSCSLRRQTFTRPRPRRTTSRPSSRPQTLVWTSTVSGIVASGPIGAATAGATVVAYTTVISGGKRSGRHVWRVRRPRRQSRAARQQARAGRPSRQSCRSERADSSSLDELSSPGSALPARLSHTTSPMSFVATAWLRHTPKLHDTSHSPAETRRGSDRGVLFPHDDLEQSRNVARSRVGETAIPRTPSPMRLHSRRPPLGPCLSLLAKRARRVVPCNRLRRCSSPFRPYGCRALLAPRGSASPLRQAQEEIIMSNWFRSIRRSIRRIARRSTLRIQTTINVPALRQGLGRIRTPRRERQSPADTSPQDGLTQAGGVFPRWREGLADLASPRQPAPSSRTASCRRRTRRKRGPRGVAEGFPTSKTPRPGRSWSGPASDCRREALSPPRPRNTLVSSSTTARRGLLVT